jgi:hypothetical protein
MVRYKDPIRGSKKRSDHGFDLPGQRPENHERPSVGLQRPDPCADRSPLQERCNVVEGPCSNLRFFATNGLRGGFHRWLNFRSARWLGFRSAPTRAPVSRGLQHSVGSHLLGAGAVLASESLGLTRLGLSSYRPTFLEETHHGSIPQRLPALGPALGPTPTSSSVTRRF